MPAWAWTWQSIIEMLDNSLLVTTFSRHIWLLQSTATRVTSMKSPLKERFGSFYHAVFVPSAVSTGNPSVRVRMGPCSPKERGCGRHAGKDRPRRIGADEAKVLSREDAGFESQSLLSAICRDDRLRRQLWISRRELRSHP